MRAILKFGGFYGSNHDGIVCDALENYFDSEDYDVNNINYRPIYETYSQVLCEKFGKILGVNLEFYELISPREYNFTTDMIEVEVSEVDALKVIDMVELGDIEDLVRHYTTARDGYIPYYSFDEVFYNTANRLEFALELLYEEFEDRIIEKMYESEFIYGTDEKVWLDN